MKELYPEETAIKGLNVSLYIIIVQIIFSVPLGSYGLILLHFKNRVPLKSVLGGAGSVALLHYCT